LGGAIIGVEMGKSEARNGDDWKTCCSEVNHRITIILGASAAEVTILTVLHIRAQIPGFGAPRRRSSRIMQPSRRLFGPLDRPAYVDLPAASGSLALGI